MARSLRADEQNLAELLQRTGLTRPASRCLVALTRGGKWTTSALAETSGLSQPGVSQGMRELVDANLAQREYEYNGQKGRPAHIYALADDAPTTLGNVEQTRRRWLATEIAACDDLRAAIKKLAP